MTEGRERAEDPDQAMGRTARDVCLIALVALLYVAPAFLPGRVLLPIDIVRDFGAWKPDPVARVATSNRLLGDPVLEYLAWDHVIARQLHNFQLPWRNPYAPPDSHLFANPEVSIFSPFMWPRLVFGVRGWALTAFLRLLTGGLGMYFLVRAVSRDRFAARLGALLFMSSGYFIVWLLYSHANVFAVAPWFVLAFLRAVAFPRPSNLLLVTLAAAAATTGGHPETLAHVVLVFLALLLFENVRARRWAWRNVVVASSAALAGLLLLGIQLVPFAAALRDSYLFVQRHQPYSSFRFAAVAAQGLPGFLGSTVQGEVDLSAFVPYSENFSERSGAFMGLLAVAVLFLGLRSATTVEKRVLLFAVLALLISWRTPVLWQLVSHVPILGSAANERFSSAFVLLACPVAALFVARGVRHRTSGFILVVVGGVAALCALLVILPWGGQLIRAVAEEGIERLRNSGYLHKGAGFYASRMAFYISALRLVAFRRLLLPAACWAAGGFALIKGRRSILATSMLAELLAFGVGFNPAVSDRGATALTPPPVIEELKKNTANTPTVAVLGDAIPANLLSLYGVRDLRSYDVLQSSAYINQLQRLGYDPVAREFPERVDPAFVDGLRRLGAAFVIARNAPRGTSRIGGIQSPAVGLYSIPQPYGAGITANEPPKGLVTGAWVSLSGLLLAFATAAVGAFTRREETLGMRKADRRFVEH